MPTDPDRARSSPAPVADAAEQGDACPASIVMGYPCDPVCVRCGRCVDAAPGPDRALELLAELVALDGECIDGAWLARFVDIRERARGLVEGAP